MVNEFITNGNYSFFVRFAFASHPFIVFFKFLFIHYYIGCHKIQNPSGVPVPSFRNMHFCFILSTLFYNRVCPNVTYNFLFVRKPSYISYLSKKLRSTHFAYPFNCGNYFNIIIFNLFNSSFNRFFQFFFNIFKEYKNFNQTFQDFIKNIRIYANRIRSELNYIRSFEFNFFMDNRRESGFKGCYIFFNRESGREIYKDIKKGIREYIEMGLNFRESYESNSFDIIFNSLDKRGYKFVLSGNNFKFKEGVIKGVRSGLVKNGGEASNSFCINFISFSWVKFNFREVMDLGWVNNRDIEIKVFEEREEREVISGSRFHCDENGVRVSRMGIEEVDKFLEILIRLFKGIDSEGGIVFNSSSEGIFGDIQAYKIREISVIHKLAPPFMRYCNDKGTGEVSESILHSDAGLRTQSTYGDLRKQRTDSFWGLEAQVKLCSSVPLSLYLNLIFSFLMSSFLIIYKI